MFGRQLALGARWAGEGAQRVGGSHIARNFGVAGRPAHLVGRLRQAPAVAVVADRLPMTLSAAQRLRANHVERRHSRYDGERNRDISLVWIVLAERNSEG